MQEQRATLNRWAWFALFCVVTVVLTTNTARYLPPTGDRFVDTLAPGATDLTPSFNAAAALLHGRNPYRGTKSLEVPDPYANTRGEAEGVSYLYPPSHALLYVPIVWLAKSDFRATARIHLALCFVCLVLLAWAIVDLLGALIEIDRSLKLALAPALVFLMALNPGSLLGFERGQSDVITAGFCWCSVVAWRRRWPLAAAFLAVAGSLLKGYGILFACGMLAIGWRRGTRAPTLLGACSAVSLLLVPVLRYLPDALFAYRIRAAMFWPLWYNQGFASLLAVFGLPHQGLGRAILVGVCVLAALAAWLRLRRIEAAEGLVDEGERALWLTAFAAASLIAVLGYSLNSLAYDCIIVMPGALILVLGQTAVAPQLPAKLRAALGPFSALVLAALFTFDVARAVGVTSPSARVPASALAELMLAALIGLCATRAIARSSTVLCWAFAAGWLSLALAAIMFGIQIGVERAVLSEDLTRGKVWRASSRSMTCSPATKNCGGGRFPVFMHTNYEQDPWLEYDLGGVRRIEVIEVLNREDCCQDNAVPLLLEVSTDRRKWRQVARKDKVFERYRVRFSPVQARYVRARVPRETMLHLERLSAWPN